jgi:predicted flap endonuclease-1-like 5' DNA nuclease
VEDEMNQESEDISKWVQELISRATREQIQGMQRLNNLMQRVTSGELNESQVRDEFNKFVKSESSRYVEDLTRLGLSFQAALVELNRKYSDRFFESMLGSTFKEQPSTNGQASQSKEIQIHLSGACGEELVKTFAIENKREEEETVNFLISEFTDAQSTMAFRPPMQVQPARLVLRPGEERNVTLRLPLLSELFTPGGIYFATVIARGRNDVILNLRVDITEPQVKAEPTLVVREQLVQSSLPQSALALQSDDLTRLKGIGPAYALKLASAGIVSYTGLAAMDEEELEHLLGTASMARARRQRWQEQARFAAAGDNAALEQLMEEIK